MKTFLSAFVFAFIATLGLAQVNPQFNPIPASFNFNLPNAVVAQDIPYDSDEPSRQAFLLFLPDTVGTFPVVIYHHGGGFTGGSRNVVLNDPVRRDRVKYFLERDIAFVSMGYRLITTNQPDTIGVKKSLYDSKRGLQFIRHHADELHIDPDVVALSGGSAGAGTAMWIASRPDMADPNSPDPVLQQSTRVCAIELSASQSTYDLYKWETDVYQNFDGQGTNYTVDSMVNDLGFNLFSSFYGGVDSNYHFLYDPALIQYRQDVDMLSQLSSDDPPLYFQNQSGAVHPNQDLYHHSNHGKVLQAAALAANLPEVRAVIQAQGINTAQGESPDEFLFRHLTACALTTDLLEEPIGEIKVYPNPAQGQFNINTTAETSLSAVQLFSLAGQLVWEQGNLNTSSLTIPTHSLPTGIYLLRAHGNNGHVWHERVMVEQ